MAGQVLRGRGGGGVIGPVKIFDAQATTAEVSVELRPPCRNFQVQFSKSSTNATLSVAGHLSPNSTIGVALLSFAASTAASALASTGSTGPLARLSFNHAAGASSGGITAWLTASP